jgi:hypothetical protein
MSSIRTWPTRIWLQRSEGGKDGDYKDHSDVTWCADAINRTDVEYVRIDLYNSLRAQLKKRGSLETSEKP